MAAWIQAAHLYQRYMRYMPVLLRTLKFCTTKAPFLQTDVQLLSTVYLSQGKFDSEIAVVSQRLFKNS